MGSQNDAWNDFRRVLSSILSSEYSSEEYVGAKLSCWLVLVLSKANCLRLFTDKLSGTAPLLNMGCCEFDWIGWLASDIVCFVGKVSEIKIPHC